MDRKFKFCVGLWCLGGCADRFLPEGYLDEKIDLEKLIDIASQVKAIEGIEIISSQLENMDTNKYLDLLEKNRLKTVGILANTFGKREFKLGSITNLDKKIRAKAMDVCKRTMELAEKIKSPAVTLWLGSDGFDYPFQIDYRKHWELLAESIRELSQINPQMKICLEYKLKEPRKHMSIATVGKALLLAIDAGKNVGVTLDFGHALMSRENPAESVVLLSKHRKLFNVHFNDAYGEWDDDMIIGSVHLPETLEFLYYLDVSNYDGWLGLDIFPFRMDACKAANLCISYIEALIRVLRVLDYGKLKEAQDTMDAVITQEIIQKALFSKTA